MKKLLAVLVMVSLIGCSGSSTSPSQPAGETNKEKKVQRPDQEISKEERASGGGPTITKEKLTGTDVGEKAPHKN